MKILIIGSGGREHALGWKIAQSPDCEKLYFAPGNGGTAAYVKKGENVDIPVTEIDKLADFAEAHVDFTVIGPELSLSLGAADVFRKRGLPVFGPDKNAAKLETSKAFAKAFMAKYGVPTAAYDVFDHPDDALRALPSRAYPLWVKADGLAAGKGAVACETEADARRTIEAIMRDKTFGGAGERIVLEEHMEGRELTLLCFTDGETILPMDSARDYKRALDGGEGLNTGGMGCVSPVPGYTPGYADDIARRTLAGIKAEGFDYRGVLYLELMLTPQGPKVIEYNARFGDPETQVLMPRLETDLLSVMRAVEARRLHEIQLQWNPQPAVCVVLASGGYPGAYKVGYPLDPLPEDTGDSTLFHAGTVLRDGQLYTDGGRVLAITALGADTDAARANAYQMAEQVHFKDKHYRKDIAL